ncbi:hypothetical protein BJ912DRAFT_1143714 [Pholiota molesta]|nr:hypothetical protein BJ912DRAFT_1143714 [Pholiota molesta]
MTVHGPLPNPPHQPPGPHSAPNSICTIVLSNHFPLKPARRERASPEVGLVAIPDRKRTRTSTQYRAPSPCAPLAAPEVPGGCAVSDPRPPPSWTCLPGAAAPRRPRKHGGSGGYCGPELAGRPARRGAQAATAAFPFLRPQACIFSSLATTNAAYRGPRPAPHQPKHPRLDATISGVFPYSSPFSILVPLISLHTSSSFAHTNTAQNGAFLTTRHVNDSTMNEDVSVVADAYRLGDPAIRVYTLRAPTRPFMSPYHGTSSRFARGNGAMTRWSLPSPLCLSVSLSLVSFYVPRALPARASIAQHHAVLSISYDALSDTALRSSTRQWDHLRGQHQAELVLDFLMLRGKCAADRSRLKNDEPARQKCIRGSGEWIKESASAIARRTPSAYTQRQNAGPRCGSASSYGASPVQGTFQSKASERAFGAAGFFTTGAAWAHGEIINHIEMSLQIGRV